MPRIARMLIFTAFIVVLFTFVTTILQWPPPVEAQTPQTAEAIAARLDTRLENVEKKLDKHMEREDVEKLSTRLAIIEDRSRLLGNGMLTVLGATLAQLLSYWVTVRKVLKGK